MLHWKAPWKRERKGLGTFIAKVEMGLERQMDCIGPDPAGGGDQGRGKSVAEQALALEKKRDTTGVPEKDRCFCAPSTKWGTMSSPNKCLIQ